MKSMKVIVDAEVILSPHFSGIGHYTLALLRAIDHQLDNDHSFSVSLLISCGQIKKAQAFGFRNIKLIRSPFIPKISNGLKALHLQPPLDLFFGEGIYIFPNFSSWPLLFSKSVPFVHDVSYEKYPELTEARNQVFLKRQVKKSIERAVIVATISESSKRDISSLYGVNKKNIEVFYPAVDKAKYYRRTPEEIARVKKKYAVTGDYILFVGNIEPRKNLGSLLLAYEQLPTSIKDKTSLLIIGAKGWRDEEISKSIARLKATGRSVQIPSQYVTDDDLPAFYSGAQLFVYPSIYEGFGIPPIEAMACGTPVLSADNSSLPEAVGDAAIAVDSLSVDNITTAISRILKDEELRRELITEGYHHIKRFSWDKSAEALISKLQTLC